MASLDVLPARNPLHIPELAIAILTSTASSEVPSSHLATSSLFHDILLPHLYRTVRLSAITQWRSFLMSTPSSHLALVRELDLVVVNEEVAWELMGVLLRRLGRELTAEERGRIVSFRVQVVEEERALDLLANVSIPRFLSLLPNLHELSFTGAYPASFASVLSMARRPGHPSDALQQTKTLRLPLHLLNVSSDTLPFIPLAPMRLVSPTSPVLHLHLPPAVRHLHLDVDPERPCVLVDEPTTEGPLPSRSTKHVVPPLEFFRVWLSTLETKDEGRSLQWICVRGPVKEGERSEWNALSKALVSQGLQLTFDQL